MARIKVAVMGSTGLVGQQFVRMLSGHPFFEICALTSSSRSAGKRYADAPHWTAGGDAPDAVNEMHVLDTSIESILKTEPRVAFSALPASIAGDIESALRNHGVFVFSNAGNHRMDEDVPIMIPEINADHLEIVRAQRSRHGGFIVTNSNCSTAGLVMALKPLLHLGIQSTTVTTFQSISGAGRQGLPAMDIVGNVIPFIRNEEEKMERESMKILGSFNALTIVPREMALNINCCRVPVREGHLMSVVIEFEGPVDRETIENALASFRGIPLDLKLPSAPDAPLIIRREEDRPQPALDAWAGSPERARGMAVSIGRIRARGRFLKLVLLVHNTIRGAAGACVLAAELAAARGFMQ